LKFGDVQITKNPYYRKRPQKGTWEVRYKRLQRALEAATARYEKHVRVTVDSVAARDRLATTIAERDPDLARKLGIEFPLTMETVGDELMRLRYASARGAVGDAEQRLGEMTDMILDQFPDLARELGLLDEEGDDEA